MHRMRNMKVSCQRELSTSCFHVFLNPYMFHLTFSLSCLSLLLGTCDSPPRLSFAELPGAVNNSYPVGTKLKYSCRPGYMLGCGKSPFVTCLENSTWSVDPEFCVVIITQDKPTTVPPEGAEVAGTSSVMCVSPEVENGRTNGVQPAYRPRDIIVFECDPGYTLSGSPETQCQDDGRWDPPVPVCERKVLCIAPEIQNGRKVAGRGPVYRPRDTVRFECDPGYTLNGSRQIQCQDEGTWDPPVPACTEEVLCIAPEIQHGRKVAGRGPVYRTRDMVRFECDPGYTLNGSRQIQCQDDRIWDPPVPVCIQGKCESRLTAGDVHNPEVENGRTNGVLQPAYRPRDIVVFECNPGYILSGSPETQCQNDGRWDPPVPVRERMLQCPSPPAIANGKPSGWDLAVFTSGMSVNYSCEPGYSLTGQASIYCTASGMWSPPPPRCEEVLCIALEIQHGRKVAGRGPVYRPRDIVRFECDPGYTLNGSHQIQCQDDRTWDPPVPVCIQALPCPPPPVIVKGKHNAKPLATFNSGTYVNYSCEPGYALRGETSIYCTTSGNWSHPSPLCEDGSGVPTRFTFAELKSEYKNQSYFPVGKTINYTCRPGYSRQPQIPPTITCLQNQRWSEALKFSTCVSPELENGRTNGIQPAYRPRDIIVFECDPGYTLSSSPETQCQDDGRWDPPVPLCERMLQCPSPPAITNGKPSVQASAVFTAGMSVNYSCEPGYSLTGQASIYCTASGTWSPPPPRCEEVLCIALEIQHGRKVAGRGPVYRPRDTVRFECDPGYTLNGSHQIQCQDDRTWDPPVPVCIQEIRCAFPEVQGGKKAVAGTTYRFGTNVTVECDNGYVLEGSSLIQCQHDFTWNPPVPVCKSRSYNFISGVLGIVGGVLLLLLVTIIIWRIMSTQNAG
ncbi:C4b-binding protein alpha chain-like [Malaclemys terrapin pileata]|uniref:C4b-binding protein alpha chain-like n=1 Tax=Malaclemys terrapin pileata TaxID=2991368 RepID=UPI0023A8E7BC|nr:C4b-binding protein alpha chain-like [Malaclemys terrapin pileata]